MGNIYDDIDIFRLIDIEGIILSVGGILEINEPEKFDEASITLERSEYHGVDFEFFDSESELVFDRVRKDSLNISAYSLIEQIFSIRGTEGRIQLQYLRTSNLDLVYTSELILSSRKLLDYAVVVRCERLNFDGDYKSRFETAYDLNSTENLNEGVITPITYEDIVLPPPNITKFLIAENIGSEKITVPDSGDNNINLAYEQEIVNQFSIGLERFETSIDQSGQFSTLFKFPENGRYTVEFDFDISFRLDSDFTSVVFRNNIVNERFKFRQSATTSITNTTPLVVGDNSVEILGAGLANTEYRVQVNETYEFYANKGDIFRSLIFCTSNFEYVVEHRSRINIEGNLRNSYIGTKAVDLKDALSKHFEGLTGISNPLTSSFLDTQNVLLLSGKLVRGFPETEAFKMYTNKALKSLKSIFGLGAFVKEDEIVIERYSYYYRDVEIIHIDEKIAEFEITIDKDLIPNEILIGYKKFSDVEDQPLVVDSNSDFLTQHEYLTSIKRDKKKVEFLSEWIASGYVFSEGKQLAFELFPEEKWKEDENLFIVGKSNTNTLFSHTVRFFRLIDDSFVDTDQYYILIDTYLPFDISDYVDLEIDGTTYTIGFSDNPQGLVDPVIPDLEKNSTIFYITDDLNTSAGVGQKSVLFEQDIILNFNFDSAETSEAFDVIDGIPFAFSTYNARYNVKNMLLNNSPILNSSFNWTVGGKYSLLSFENNASLRTQFKVGENNSTLDPDRDTIVQSDDLLVSDANNGDALFIPEILTFETRLSFETIMSIRESHYDENNASYYGYISVTPYNSIKYKGFLRKMEYNPITEMIKFTLIRKKD